MTLPECDLCVAYLGVTLGVAWLKEAERFSEGELPELPEGGGKSGPAGLAAETANSDSDRLKDLGATAQLTSIFASFCGYTR